MMYSTIVLTTYFRSPSETQLPGLRSPEAELQEAVRGDGGGHCGEEALWGIDSECKSSSSGDWLAVVVCYLGGIRAFNKVVR
jgi:hypothetical protein